MDWWEQNAAAGPIFHGLYRAVSAGFFHQSIETDWALYGSLWQMFMGLKFMVLSSGVPQSSKL